MENDSDKLHQRLQSQSDTGERKMAEYIKKCPECGSINLFVNKDRGEIICKNCGLVIEEKIIDMGQEWREFDDDSG